MRAAIIMALVTVSCGLGGEAGNRGENLPTVGGGPYGKLRPDDTSDATEPYVVVDRAANLTDPAVLAIPGGGYALWYTRTAVPATGATEIWHSEILDLHDLPLADPVRVLAAAEPWEQGSVRAPAVVLDADERVVLFYEAGLEEAPLIGRATSADGHDAVRDAMPVLMDAGDPTVLILPEGRWLLYHTRPDRSGIFLAESSDDGVTFTVHPDPVLDRRDQDRDAFDRVWIGEPDVVGGISAAGQLRIGLFYTGQNAAGEFAIGHAVSVDGLVFERFFNGNAILDPGGPDERGAAAWIGPAEGVLFFSQRQTNILAIAAAVHP